MTQPIIRNGDVIELRVTEADPFNPDTAPLDMIVKFRVDADCVGGEDRVSGTEEGVAPATEGSLIRGPAWKSRSSHPIRGYIRHLYKAAPVSLLPRPAGMPYGVQLLVDELRSLYLRLDYQPYTDECALDLLAAHNRRYGSLQLSERDLWGQILKTEHGFERMEFGWIVPELLAYRNSPWFNMPHGIRLNRHGHKFGHGR